VSKCSGNFGLSATLCTAVRYTITFIAGKMTCHRRDSVPKGCLTTRLGNAQRCFLLQRISYQIAFELTDRHWRFERVGLAVQGFGRGN